MKIRVINCLSERYSIKVGARDAHKVVSEMYERVKTDERIQALGIETVMADAQQAFLALVDIRTKVDSWSPKEWAAKRESGDASVATYTEAFHTLLEFKGCLDDACKESAQMKRGVTRRKTDRAKKFEELLAAGSVPDKMCEFVGSALGDRYGDDSCWAWWYLVSCTFFLFHTNIENAT